MFAAIVLLEPMTSEEIVRFVTVITKMAKCLHHDIKQKSTTHNGSILECDQVVWLANGLVAPFITIYFDPLFFKSPIDLFNVFCNNSVSFTNCDAMIIY